MQLGWPATSLENWVLRNRVGFDSSAFRHIKAHRIVFDTKAGQADVLLYGELAELGLRQRFAKPSTMSSGSLVRIQYSPPKLCVGD